MDDFTPFEELVRITQPEDNVWENIVDALKLKTFVWVQYLCRDKIIPVVPFYNPDEIYLSFDTAMEHVSYDGPYDDNLILNCYDHKFSFKVVIEDIKHKSTKKSKIDPFVYPDTIYLTTKIKTSDSFNQLLKEKFSINPISLFNGNIKVVKIVLITETKYNEIQGLTHSEYSNQKMSTNTLLQDEFVYFFFFHPSLCKLSDIHGFLEYNTNPASLLNLDYRLKRRPKPTSH